jgi:hypothetical protein
VWLRSRIPHTPRLGRGVQAGLGLAHRVRVDPLEIDLAGLGGGGIARNSTTSWPSREITTDSPFRAGRSTAEVRW